MPHEHERRPRRAPRAPQGGQELSEPPPGLLEAERRWLAQRAAEVGGLTAAFRHLVRLAILSDACLTTMEGCKSIERHARRAGLSRAAAWRRARAWGVRRAAWPLGGRHLNTMTWRRPGTPGGYGDARDAGDDPAVPLPRAVVRRLIVEGRPACTSPTSTPVFGRRVLARRGAA